MGRRVLGWLAAGLVLLVALVWLRPEPELALIPPQPAVEIGLDPTAYLAAREAAVPDLREGAEKRILWAGARGAPTPLALVYIHGFSASSEELRPVPDLVADTLGANLYFARLAGHGRDGPAMAAADLAAWGADLAEAVAIGRRIGDRVLLMGTSAGGALAALAAADPALSEPLAGVVLVSPSFRLNAPAAGLLTWPGASVFVPRLLGETRSFTPLNEAHSRHWTSEYPTAAVLPLAQLVRAARRADYAGATAPALFVLSDDDAVVDAAETRAVAARWGGPHRILALELGPDDDPVRHVLAGDILSPGQTASLAQAIAAWARDL